MNWPYFVYLSWNYYFSLWPFIGIDTYLFCWLFSRVSSLYPCLIAIYLAGILNLPGFRKSSLNSNLSLMYSLHLFIFTDSIIGEKVMTAFWIIFVILLFSTALFILFEDFNETFFSLWISLLENSFYCLLVPCNKLLRGQVNEQSSSPNWIFMMLL